MDCYHRTVSYDTLALGVSANKVDTQATWYLASEVMPSPEYACSDNRNIIVQT